MRKKVFLTIFFLSALVLSGCSQQKEQVIPGENNENEDLFEGDNGGSEQDNPGSESEVDEEEARDDEEEARDDEEEGDIEEEGDSSRSSEDEPIGEVDDSWRTYTKEDKNVEVEYPQNWYYRRALTEELDNDYYLFVEFADTPDVFEGEATSTIQLIGADTDQEIEELEYAATAQEVSDKKFLLRTNDRDLKDTVDEMAATFKFSPEDQ